MILNESNTLNIFDTKITFSPPAKLNSAPGPAHTCRIDIQSNSRWGLVAMRAHHGIDMLVNHDGEEINITGLPLARSVNNSRNLRAAKLIYGLQPGDKMTVIAKPSDSKLLINFSESD